MKAFKKLFILMVIFELFLVGQVYSSSVTNSSNEVIPLRIKVGMITEAEFPEEIANVTKSISSDFLQVETLGNKLFLLARENFDSRLYVVTQDNESFCLHLIIDEIEAPTHIKIKKRPETAKDEQDKKALNTIELMKAILNGKMPQGSVNSKLQAQEIFNNGKFRITIDEIYEFPGNVKAIILTFENLSSKPVVVPIEHIELPGLLAISIDSQILDVRPQDTKKQSATYTTKAYMVVEGGLN